MGSAHLVIPSSMSSNGPLGPGSSKLPRYKTNRRSLPSQDQSVDPVTSIENTDEEMDQHSSPLEEYPKTTHVQTNPRGNPPPISSSGHLASDVDAPESSLGVSQPMESSERQDRLHALLGPTTPTGLNQQDDAIRTLFDSVYGDDLSSQVPQARLREMATLGRPTGGDQPMNDHDDNGTSNSGDNSHNSSNTGGTIPPYPSLSPTSSSSSSTSTFSSLSSSSQSSYSSSSLPSSSTSSSSLSSLTPPGLSTSMMTGRLRHACNDIVTRLKNAKILVEKQTQPPMKSLVRLIQQSR